MNKAVLNQVVRSFLPELAIGSACCAAGYFFLVDPLVKKLADAQAEVDALTLAITRSESQPPVADTARAERAQRALDGIAVRSALTADQARLLQAVSTLADSCNVRVEQFNPATPKGPRAVPGQSAAKADPKIEQRTALSIALTGTFADTARFVRAMQQDVGFTTVRSLRLTPTSASAPDAVSVSIETEHVAVNTKALEASTTAAAAPAGMGQPQLPPHLGQQTSVPSERHQ